MNHRILPRHKWNILRYVGCALPPLTGIQREIIRNQLSTRYCPECGEYIYNPFKRRRIRHYHRLLRVNKYQNISHQRIIIHPNHQLVEWTRRNPSVMKLLINDDDIYFYNNMKPCFIHRIPAVRMWTIDEWNTLYPNYAISKTDCLKRLGLLCGTDPLWTPDVVIHYKH